MEIFFLKTHFDQMKTRQCAIFYPAEKSKATTRLDIKEHVVVRNFYI